MVAVILVVAVFVKGQGQVEDGQALIVQFLLAHRAAQVMVYVIVLEPVIVTLDGTTVTVVVIVALPV